MIYTIWGYLVMRNSNKIFLIQDDSERQDPKHFTQEELQRFYSAPAIPKEELTEILLSSMIK